MKAIPIQDCVHKSLRGRFCQRFATPPHNFVYSQARLLHQEPKRHKSPKGFTWPGEKNISEDYAKLRIWALQLRLYPTYILCMHKPVKNASLHPEVQYLFIFTAFMGVYKPERPFLKKDYTFHQLSVKNITQETEQRCLSCRSKCFIYTAVILSWNNWHL